MEQDKQSVQGHKHHHAHHQGVTVQESWIDFHDIYPRAVVQEPAPYFEAVTSIHQQVKPIKLTDFKGKYVVLFFYPLDFTFVCPTEILSFADAYPEFEKTNCVLLGASTDSVFSHHAYTQQPRNKGGLGDINLPLIADYSKAIARIYGALITKGPNAGVASRATFIIDGKGILRHASYNDLPVGRNVDEVLRLVQAFQYTDEHGEVCPAKWRPGGKTMKTDHNSEVTQKYWEEEHAKGK
jgi:alkyl hydroperoxide reductase subunit AhpC